MGNRSQPFSDGLLITRGVVLQPVRIPIDAVTDADGGLAVQRGRQCHLVIERQVRGRNPAVETAVEMFGLKAVGVETITGDAAVIAPPVGVSALEDL